MKGAGEMVDRKKTTERFPLRLPVELDAEIRKIARGDGTGPASTINETIVFLLREALRARKDRQGVSEKEPGQWRPARLAA